MFPLRERAGGGRQSYDLGCQLLPQVPDVRLGIDAAAGDTLDRLLRRELRTQAVEVLAEPLPEVVELAALEALVQIAEILERAFPDLHGHDIAERIRREVAERAARPVHVLQHS